MLDRLAGWESVVTPERIRHALAQTGRVNERSCKLTHEVMLWVVIAMGLLTDVPIRQVFKACRRGRRGETTPQRSRLCEARQRLGVEAVQQWHADIVRPLATVDTPECRRTRDQDWKDLMARKIQLLVRVKNSLVLKRVRVLSDGSYVAKIDPTTDARHKDRDGLEVRVIEYTLNDPQRIGHGETHRGLMKPPEVEGTG